MKIKAEQLILDFDAEVSVVYFKYILNVNGGLV